MRFVLAGMALATLLASAAWAAPGDAVQKPLPDVRKAPMCDSPPCSREELARYEKKLIKRMQKANAMSAEARFRGETKEADRLHKVFARTFDRRAAVRVAMDDPSRN
jgi:hypothetical protein